MQRHHAAWLRLVVDNSRRIGLEQFLVHGDAPVLAKPENPKVNPFRELLGCSPVAYGAERESAGIGNRSGPAEGVNNIAHFCQGGIVHEQVYSDGLNFVKQGKTEFFGRPRRSSIWALFKARQMKLPEVSPLPTGMRLIAARLALSLKQNALCRSLNVAPNTWNQWERGIHPPDVEAMIRLTIDYDISLEWIYLGRAGSMPGDRRDKVLARYKQLLAEAELAEPA